MFKRTKAKSSKRAFTLLELVLVIAILLIMMPIIYGTFYLVYISHTRVILVNDARDYASLSAMAIDNVITNASSADAADSVAGPYAAAIYADTTDGNLYIKKGTGAAVKAFDYPQYNAPSGAQKWKLVITFTVDSASKTVMYRIDVIDNATADIAYTLESSVFLPNGNRSDSEKLETGAGKVLNFSNPA